jgi:ATP-binding cassette subfamily B protein
MRAANCHDLFLASPGKFPEGWHTTIGASGCRLSGGERQRLAIARAFLQRPAVLLLDEATSALDNESQALVQGALTRLMQGRTVIMIAHRLSTLRAADKIVCVMDGRNAEEGTHSELLESGGVYARYHGRLSQAAEGGDCID